MNMINVKTHLYKYVEYVYICICIYSCLYNYLFTIHTFVYLFICSFIYTYIHTLESQRGHAARCRTHDLMLGLLFGGAWI